MNTKSTENDRARRSSPSLFGPIVLIAAGFYLLLANLNLLPDLNWEAAARLWPLLLIFLGLNILVRQAPRPLGAVLSALVAVAAVVTFSLILLLGNRLSFISSEPELQREQVSVALDGARRALVAVDFNSFGGRLYALEDSDRLLEGTITHRGELLLDSSTTGTVADVSLETREQGSSPFFWLDPANWDGATGAADAAWQIGLNPRTNLYLNLNLASGATELDLEDLTVGELEIDGASGHSELTLPAGDYETTYDVGSGSVAITLPDGGQSLLRVEGGSGSLTLHLPRTTQMRLVVTDGGSGAFAPGARLVQVEREDGDEGTWETEDFATAADRVTVFLDMASGSVSVADTP